MSVQDRAAAPFREGVSDGKIKR